MLTGMLGENISRGQQGKEASRQQEEQEDLSLARYAHTQIAAVYTESMLACHLTEWPSLASDQQWLRRGESFDVYPGPGMNIAGSDLCDTRGRLAREYSCFGNILGRFPGVLHTAQMDVRSRIRLNKKNKTKNNWNYL